MSEWKTKDSKSVPEQVYKKKNVARQIRSEDELEAIKTVAVVTTAVVITVPTISSIASSLG